MGPAGVDRVDRRSRGADKGIIVQADSERFEARRENGKNLAEMEDSREREEPLVDVVLRPKIARRVKIGDTEIFERAWSDVVNECKKIRSRDAAIDQSELDELDGSRLQR